jgi:ankyrin repeat protein
MAKFANIHDAVARGTIDDVKPFIKENMFAVNDRDNKGNTPLNLTVLDEKVDIAKFLLSKGANVNIGDSAGFGISLLHFAVTWGKYELSKVFLENGARVNAQNSSGETPLHIVADIKNQHVKWFGIATKDAEHSLAKRLLNIPHKIYLDIAKLLVSYRADMNVKTDRKKTPLDLAMESGDNDMIQYLSSMGAKSTPPEQKYYDIFAASTNGTPEDVKYFIEEEKVDIDEADCIGRTPLHCTASIGNLAVAEYLVSKGADVNKTGGEENKAPLHTAVGSLGADIVKLLISSGADVNLKDANGLTPLHHAALHMEDMLYRSNYNMGSPLVIKIAKDLISHGADTNAKSNTGETAYDLAKKLNDTLLVQYLGSLSM